MGSFLWHDFWNPVGPLHPYYGDRIVYDSAIHTNAHVAEVIEDGRWNWPIANSADLIDIKNRCVNYHIEKKSQLQEKCSLRIGSSEPSLRVEKFQDEVRMQEG